MFLLALGLQQGRQHHRQGLGVVEAVQGGDLVAQHVGGPVLRYTGSDQAVQRQGGTPHDVGAHLVVFRFHQRLGALFQQGQQQALGEAILHLGVDRVGEVLLQDVHEGIHHPVGHLTGRQGVGEHGVEHGKARHHEGREEVHLVAAAAPGHHGTHVHLGTGGRQGQHGAERDGGAHFVAHCLEDVPGIPGRIIMGSRGDELGAVQHGAAADGQQEVDPLGAGQLDRPHQGLVGGVGLDAAEFKQGHAGQFAADLGQQAAAHHAAATVGDEDAGVARQLFTQLGDLALAEQDLGRGMQGEVVHRHCLLLIVRAARPQKFNCIFLQTNHTIKTTSC